MAAPRFLTDADIDPLAEGVFAVLEDVGILCQNEQMLKALETAGAEVDYVKQRAWFPRPMVAEFVESFRQQQAQENDEPTRFVAPGLPRLTTQVAQLFYDYEQQEQRSANKQDFIHLIEFGDVLHGEEGVGHCLSLTDVPPLLEPLEAAMLLAEYGHNPGPAFAWNVKQIDYLIEMGDILGIANWFTWGAICFAHPLRFDKDVADKFVRRVREGVPTGLTAMPIAGVTTPATLEGFIVVASAEHIATWIAARVLNPQVPLKGDMWAGTVDMKTGHVSYCAFDAMFYAFAGIEFLRKWCGMDMPVGGGEYCDAKEPGLYTALEKAYKAMTIAAFTGRHPGVGQGMLDEGRMLSDVQLLLERELALGLQHFARPIQPTAENIALPAIREVGLALHTNYLEVIHTLEHFRSCLWLPELIERAGWNGFEGEAQVLQKTQDKVNSLVAEYVKPEGRDDKLAAMRSVVAKARKELC